MKKLFAIITCTIMLVTILSGCEAFEEVSREPIDVKYTEAYDGVETEYKYMLNGWTGTPQLVPDIKTVHRDEKWEIQYLITYADGFQGTQWCSCTEEEYNRVKDELNLDEKER